MNGLIAVWKGPVYNTTSNNYSYYVPTIPNWYVCDGSQIDSTFTTPNMVGYIPVGLSPTDLSNNMGDISGNQSISEDIGINNHTHDITITTSSVLNTMDISYTIGKASGLNSNNTGIQSPFVVHSHYMTNQLYGTTSLLLNIDTDSSGSTYRLNYVSQHFIIYYASISYTQFLFKGMIFHWYGNITTEFPYQPVDSNGDTISNWYVCSELNSNLQNYVIPVVDNKIVVISTSGYSIVDLSSTTIRDPIDFISHNHSISSTTTTILTQGTDNNVYSTNSSITIGDTTIEPLYSSIGSDSFSILQQHSHSVDSTTYTFDQTLTTPELSNNIFKYINLYAIIYLPP